MYRLRLWDDFTLLFNFFHINCFNLVFQFWQSELTTNNVIFRLCLRPKFRTFSDVNMTESSSLCQMYGLLISILLGIFGGQNGCRWNWRCVVWHDKVGTWENSPTFFHAFIKFSISLKFWCIFDNPTKFFSFKSVMMFGHIQVLLVT